MPTQGKIYRLLPLGRASHLTRDGDGQYLELNFYPSHVPID